MKIFLTTCLFLLMIGSNAFAVGNIDLGKGGIGYEPYHPKSATLSLEALQRGVVYDVSCKVSDPDAQAYPAIVKFELTNGMERSVVYFDNQPLHTGQAKLSDNNEHTATFPGVEIFAGSNTTNLVLTWLAGDGIADPVLYDCSAYPSFGLK